MNITEQYSICKNLHRSDAEVHCVRSSDNNVYRVTADVHELVCVHPLERRGHALVYARNTQNNTSDMHNGLFARIVLRIIQNKITKAR
ncbi:MAG TPA: hypothetical protein DD611_00790 [Alphaproteobacteria bacterium]|nr:hypothetical protein [Alphaproteobacteria bacterium]HBS76978.1 hypothetical protein [Alphaproteobacteria bacterium]